MYYYTNCRSTYLLLYFIKLPVKNESLVTKIPVKIPLIQLKYYVLRTNVFFYVFTIMIVNLFPKLKSNNPLYYKCLPSNQSQASFEFKQAPYLFNCQLEK